MKSHHDIFSVVPDHVAQAKRDGGFFGEIDQYYAFLDFYLGPEEQDPLVWGQANSRTVTLPSNGRFFFHGTIIVRGRTELVHPEWTEGSNKSMLVYCNEIVFEGNQAEVVSMCDMSFHINKAKGNLRFESLNYTLVRAPGHHGVEGTPGSDTPGVAPSGSSGRNARKRFGSSGSSTPGGTGGTGAKGGDAVWDPKRIDGEDGKEGAKGADIFVFITDPLPSGSRLEMISRGGRGSQGGDGANGKRGGKGQTGGTGGGGGKGGYGHSSSAGGNGGPGGRGGNSADAGNGGRGGKGGDSGTLRFGYSISDDQYAMENPVGLRGSGARAGVQADGGQGGEGGGGGLGGDGWLGGSDGSSGGYGHKGPPGRRGRAGTVGRPGANGHSGEQLPQYTKFFSTNEAIAHFLSHDAPEKAKSVIDFLGFNLPTTLEM